ncbi:hypothetical protein Pcinc_035583 [Petrolisthes cinctipes]|uniref:Uncharacterized protein n=1 Tax=Petrolisthes cinctipes TaxID=88211 RepID=A0AAE1BZK5_PETCI|nr:hypothetical protein Pcinc_035583 [Petrolisthes cinctipes]
MTQTASHLMCRDGYHYEAPVNDCQNKEQRSEGYKHVGVAVIPIFRTRPGRSACRVRRARRGQGLDSRWLAGGREADKSRCELAWVCTGMRLRVFRRMQASAGTGQDRQPEQRGARFR